MSLVRGSRLGPYEILALIGAGGMGEVYAARDTRLDRTVAIKILPAGLADGEHRARFEREAHVIAALSHPHICSLHDIGEHEHSLFLVLEHVVGQTLADRLQHGALPVDRAIAIAVQIADALDAAHKQGVVHRDLKPGNVMLTKAGIKLLDFGVAKLTDRGGPGALSGMTLPATSEVITGRRTVVGTLQYMAPEQLEGREVDPRADLWALGIILYEMVSGHRPFDGGASANIVAAILEGEPQQLTTTRPDIAPALDQLVKQCLVKDPDERWHSAHDVRLQLAAIAAADQRPSWKPARRRSIAGAISIAAAAAIVGFLGGHRPAREGVRSSVVGRLVVSADAEVAQVDSQSSVAVSADGRLVAFLGRVRDDTQVFLRRLDGHDAVPLEGTGGALAPFFSPDGRWLGIFQEGKLKKVPTDGGSVQTIADAPTGRGAVWRSDDTIFFAPSQAGPIFQVSADGGSTRPVTALNAAAGETSHRFPQLIEGGRALMFTVRTGRGFDDAEIAVWRLASGERKTIVRHAVHGEAVSTGHLVFAKGTTLMAAPFDAERLEMLASPVPVIEDIRYGGNGGVADFAVSGNGTLVYAPASLYSTPAELVRVSRSGAAVRITDQHLPFREVDISPNGRFVVVSADSGEAIALWLVDIGRGTIQPLVREHRNETPFWMPDGSGIVFSSNRDGVANLFSMRVDRPSEPQKVRSSQDWSFPMGVTPDGRGILYGEVNPATGWDVWFQPLDESGRLRKLLGGSSHERHARLSPDGRAMAFVTDESERDEVYVVAYPTAGERLQISTGGGSQPVWAHSGRELFFRQDNGLMVVEMETGTQLRAGSVKTLFRSAFKTSPAYMLTYDVMPGDREFVIIRALGTETIRVNVVLNWFDELRRKAPGAH